MGKLLSHHFLSGDLISPDNKASCQKCSFSLFKLKFLITSSEGNERDFRLFVVIYIRIIDTSTTVLQLSSLSVCKISH